VSRQYKAISRFAVLFLFALLVGCGGGGGSGGTADSGADEPWLIPTSNVADGGPGKDGIPALVNPKLIAPQEAAYLIPEELVFGVKINGDVRAYPLRVLDWHEMFNDVIGGVPVSLAYCTLCGSGILYETTVAGRDQPFEFGSSGFLYRSNKLMYDRETNSLWNQFTGSPVVGELTNSGIVLKTRPVAITTWEDWFAHQGGEPPTAPIEMFDNYVYALEAATRDEGIVLAWHGFADHYLATGSLTPIADDWLDCSFKLYACLTVHGSANQHAKRCLRFLEARFRNES